MTDPLRIAYLTSVYPRACDTFIRGEVEQLRAMGATVDTFSIRRPTPDHLVGPAVMAEHAGTTYLLDGGLARLLLATLAVKLLHPLRFLRALSLAWRTGMPGLRYRVRQLAYLMEAALLAREVRRRGIQHIHDHIGESSGTVAMLAAGLAGVTYSITFHGPSIFYAPRQWALGEKVARSAFTVCISEFCKSQCMAFTDPEAWGKLKIVRCGVEPSILDAPPTPVPDAPRLVCVGRLCAEKGQLLLLEAVRRLKSEQLRVELEFVGDGELRAELERRIAEMGLGTQARVLGWMNSAAVFERLRTARALVLPSFAEGLPVVIMEALALGRPVITTAIAGIPELVADGVNGWLVPAGSVERLTDALRAALTTPVDRLTAMGAAGRNAVAERHNQRVEAGKLLKLMQVAADGRG